MPSGQTHDRITLWSLPAVTSLTLAATQSGNLALIVSGGFLFSGLMFSPDLDLKSRPFKRWGWLRWIWIPYQKAMRHRSLFSHGLFIGTTLRVLYLGLWTILIGVLTLGVVQLFRDVPWSWARFTQELVHSLIRYRVEWIALFIGLELGAMTHSVSDWTHSAFKRSKKRPRRKSTARKRNSSRRTSKRM